MERSTPATAAYILIVEDQLLVARDLQGRLRELGYPSSEIATTGEVALRRVERQQPDLILMDIRLAGALDGIQVAERVQARFNTPIVYVTAHADHTTLARAARTTPAAYLIKPYEDDELQEAIEQALGA